jgi:hypothetical protein
MIILTRKSIVHCKRISLYANYIFRSERADELLLSDFMDKYNSISKNPYRSVVWRSVDRNGNSVYHTNVVQAMLKDHVVLCTSSINNEQDKKRVVEELTSSKLNERPREIIDIDFNEMENMAGNMIML